ncbi:MAG: diguanylate cyclase [Desulfuromonadaceae bacterium]|nr:diguanylate cyclase [Desulfuromonadaceae bacterium]
MKYHLLILTSLFLFVGSIAGAADLTRKTIIGVLAFQPKSTAAQSWSILGDYLSTTRPELGKVLVQPYSEQELERAIQSSQIDFILTNPAQYIQFHHHYGLSAPLVTVVRGSAANPLTAFGGTIFTLTDNNRVNSLRDLAAKKVAIPFQTAFGAAEMQQYELLLNELPTIRDEQFVLTGLPHDNMVRAVLNGEAEVGFARAGTLERMAANGQIRLSQFKIINKQLLGCYPAQVSTHLYPEWPLAALRHVSPTEQGDVIAALLDMRHIPEGTLPFGVRGFLPPANYSSVENMMRALRVPPFEAPPQLTLDELWTQYQWPILAIILTLLLISTLSFYLLISRRRLYQAQQELKELSEKDALTGLYNRRKFFSSLDAEWVAARRSGNRTALLLIDIDHFKTYNDRYGHLEGDSALVKVAATLKENLLRPRDLVARYGGEEFIVLLPETEQGDALHVAQRLRKSIEQISLHPVMTTPALTISIGVASLGTDETQKKETLIELADQALYEAKRSGRNCVKTPPGTTPEELSA